MSITEKRLEIKKESKFKTMLDIEVLEWFLGLERDARDELLDESKAGNWKSLVKYIKEKS